MIRIFSRTLETMLLAIVALARMIGIVCLVLMMLHITLDVALRYIFNAPLPGTITFVASYYMIFLVFVGLVVTESQRGHIEVEFFAELMPAVIGRFLETLGAALTTAVFLLLAWRSFEVALQQTAVGARVVQGTLTVWTWPAYWALPIGCGAMALLSFVRFLGIPVRVETD